MFRFHFIISFVLLLASCANIVPPSGGPKDTTPPRVLQTSPENYSLNFESKSISILFDEFVKLNDVTQQVFISPRLEEKPDIKIKGKSVVINLKAPLKDSTTYTIYFGNAIGDITENNILTSFEYVFATGNQIDSSSVEGMIIDAFTHEPLPEILLMLYMENDDSIPYLREPYYVTRTKEDGSFVLNNLKNIPYKVFALKDANSNYIYDLPNEDIGFFEELVTPFAKARPKHDSIAADTNFMRMDFDFEPVDIKLFREKDTSRTLLKAWLAKEKKITMAFRAPIKDLEINALNFTEAGEWYLREYSKNRDTLSLWLLDEPRDTLELQIVERGEILDTATIPLVKFAPARRPARKKKAAAGMSIKSNASNRFNPYDSLRLYFDYPLKAYQANRIILLKDSVEIKPEIFVRDSLKMQLIIYAAWQEETQYSLILPDSIFTDISGKSNDSVSANFKTQASVEFGSLELDVQIPEPEGPYIFQLLSEGGGIVDEMIISRGLLIPYPHLLPGKYQFRVIYDSNGNGKWDTGSYLLGIQPEKVFYTTEPIEVRANWEIKETRILP